MLMVNSSKMEFWILRREHQFKSVNTPFIYTMVSTSVRAWMMNYFLMTDSTTYMSQLVRQDIWCGMAHRSVLVSELNRYNALYHMRIVERWAILLVMCMVLHMFCYPPPSYCYRYCHYYCFCHRYGRYHYQHHITLQILVKYIWYDNNMIFHPWGEKIVNISLSLSRNHCTSTSVPSTKYAVFTLYVNVLYPTWK